MGATHTHSLDQNTSHDLTTHHQHSSPQSRGSPAALGTHAPRGDVLDARRAPPRVLGGAAVHDQLIGAASLADAYADTTRLEWRVESRDRLLYADTLVHRAPVVVAPSPSPPPLSLRAASKWLVIDDDAGDEAEPPSLVQYMRDLIDESEWVLV